MTIYCLIRPEPASIYMVNRIHEFHPVKGVIMEIPKAGSVWKRMIGRIKKMDVSGLIEALRNRWYDFETRKQRDQDYHEIFGEQWAKMADDIPVKETSDIHDIDIVTQLKTDKPDLILVHGTSILKNSMLSIPQYALNIHWGLSPYYKGVRCTEWALVNGDPFNIGVTVHELSDKIDGGRILAQEKPKITASDTAHRINMKLSSLGTEIMRQAIDQLKAGKELVFHPQDSEKGQLILIRHWTKHHHRRLIEIERKGLMAEILNKPVQKHRLKIHPFSY